jgi:hypothetical protein
MGRARPFHEIIKVWDGKFDFFYLKKSCSTDTFLSLLGLYDHQWKIMSYHVIKENDIIHHPRP